MMRGSPVKIRMTSAGKRSVASPKTPAQRIPTLSVIATVLEIADLSPLPKYCAARTPPPLESPKESNEKTKNGWFASVTAERASCEMLPTIRLSVRASENLIRSCSAIGRASAHSALKKCGVSTNLSRRGTDLPDAFDVTARSLENLVRVALFREEQLAVHREFLFPGILRDERVEMSLASVFLGTEHAAEALRFFLAASEGPRNLDEDARVRKIDREVADLGDHQVMNYAFAEFVIKDVAFLVRHLSRDERDVELGGKLFKLIDVLPDDKHPVAVFAVMGEEFAHDFGLFWICAGDANFFAGFREGVFHLEFGVHRNAHFVTRS